MSGLVVHCKKLHYDTYIGRPSKWGNPFVISKDGDRAAVVARYEEWLKEQPHLVWHCRSCEARCWGAGAHPTPVMGMYCRDSQTNRTTADL